MMHRIPVDAEEAREWGQEGYVDPFDAEETDPLQTGAIESSVWELETLMSHWHPNVATLCRIIKEQFTKERYMVEDFLDHSYGSVSICFCCRWWSEGANDRGRCLMSKQIGS